MVSREENFRRVREERSLSEISGERSEIGRDQGGQPSPAPKTDALGMKTENLSAFYDSFKAVTDVSMEIRPNKVTALIGPSGCGKSTFLRCLNRMHEVIPNAYARLWYLLRSQMATEFDSNSTTIRTTMPAAAATWNAGCGWETQE